MSEYNVYIKILRPRRSYALIVFICMFITAILESLGISLLLPLIEIILGEKSNSSLSNILNSAFKLIGLENNVLFICILFLCVLFAKIIFRLYTTYSSNKLCYDLRKDIISSICDNYLESPYQKIIKQKQGVLLNNLLHEPHQAIAGLMHMFNFLISLVMVLFYYILLMLTHYETTMIITITSLIMYFVYTKMSKNYINWLGRKDIHYNQEINSITAESISAIRQIKTFMLSKKILQELSRNLESLKIINLKNVLFQNSPRALIEILIFSGIIAAVLISYYRSTELLISLVPVFGIFVIVSQRLLLQTGTIVSSRAAIQFSLPSINLVYSLIEDHVHKKTVDSDLVIFEQLESDIKFNNISFAYSEKDILFKNVSFSIPKGKITAIIGESGVGKSTIADLILGFYTLEQGTITINNVNINELNKKSWREKIGFVSQDNFLFHSSILDNILISNDVATKEDVINAAKKANAHDFIMKMPEDYDTIVGDRGIMLSGGQKQRIAIARALLRDPELLIFDEATSSLDIATEERIIEEVIRIARDKTLIIITHKKELVKEADRIYKIENKKLFSINKEEL